MDIPNEANAASRKARRWWAHVAIVVLFGLGWFALAIAPRPPSRANSLQLEGLVVVLAGFLWVVYAALTTVAMVWLQRHKWGTAIAHAGVAALLVMAGVLMCGRP